MTVGVVVPVVIPSRSTAAPVGRELTEILPTADAATGRRRGTNNRQSIKNIFFITLHPFFPS
jgi:hypothetical protein